ncbi:MAG: phage portal protein [Acutalibacteraceae bacterium]
MKWPKLRKRSAQEIAPNVDDVLLSAILSQDSISSEQALNIPAVARCVNLISETVSMIPIKLYREKIADGKRKTAEILDQRCDLLNEDTKDTLDGAQFKKALVRDYLLNGSAYAYINKQRNSVKSLHYVDSKNITINQNFDPIFKDYNILIQGKSYKPFEFLKILRATKDGARGNGVVDENGDLLKVAYTTLKFEQNLVSTGGNKKGFINAKNRLTKEATDALKAAWYKFYSNNDENVIILNDGLSFQEASNTSVEMQLNESKKLMSDSILEIFGVPIDWSWETFIKTAIMPILATFECALNRDLLLKKEKKSFYFAFDTKEIIKGDIKTRFEAYKTALESNLMQIDEVRYLKNLEPLGLNFIKLGLQDVLFNPVTKEVYTPNTNQITNIENKNGGNIHE